VLSAFEEINGRAYRVASGEGIVIASQAGFYVVEGEALALAVEHALKEEQREEKLETS